MDARVLHRPRPRDRRPAPGGLRAHVLPPNVPSLGHRTQPPFGSDSPLTAPARDASSSRPAPPDRPPGYPAHLERQLASAGELSYRVRPILPGDAERLVEFHSHLSMHSTYLRFFTFHPRLSPAEVERFTHVDYRDRLALVAESGDRLIGVGRYDRAPGSDEAEVAFVVADEYQHHGIGALLLDELARAAREQGIATFVAETLEENRTMLDVFFHSGYPTTSRTEYGTVSVRFPIAETEVSRAALAGRERSRQP